ncbi:MAG TPA: FAD-dependent monooxygenase [Steroidobacteraceae bacterium]|nr:FAD-dependent monooxygenase [Steroidobacteraceae bacterium]
MGATPRVLIVGGGIAGLSTAIALGRRGIEHEVVELNPAWSVYGVGIIQPSNQLRALASIGLAEAVLASGFGYPGYEVRDAHGTKMASAASANVNGPGFPSINGITRTALHAILSSTALGLRTPVRLGTTVDHWRESPDGVRVCFTDGTEGRYDLVVAADGASSAMRKMLFGAAPVATPSFTGIGCWRHNFPKPVDLTWGQIWFGPQSKAGLIPLTGELMYMFVMSSEPGNPRHPGETLHRIMRQRLEGFGGLIGELRDRITDPGAVVYRPIEVLLVEPFWYRGRVLLIGDAAHTSSPQLASGASMAIEDAVLLSDMLASASAQEDMQSLLRAFQTRRMPRVKLVYETGVQLCKWELDNLTGKPHAEAEHAALMSRAWETLMQPI